MAYDQQPTVVAGPAMGKPRSKMVQEQPKEPPMANGRGKRTLMSVEIERAADGGFVIRKRFDNSNSGPAYQPPETNVCTSTDDLIALVRKCFPNGQKGASG